MPLRPRPVTTSVAAALATLALAGCGAGAARENHGAGTQAAASTARTGTTSRQGTGTAGATGSTAGTGTSGATVVARTSAAARATRRRNRVLARIAHVGRLPQTAALPSANTRVFRAEMHALWAAVRSDRPALARPAFFPLAAYLQVKAIYDARADWRTRLVGDFNLDVRAAHQLLGPNPGAAHLLRVSVPASYAHWIPPGVCDNQLGYYEMPNARVVYRTGGSVRSFGIASMISWRGLWFVVHLGAILRPATIGEVDSPSDGPGVSAPSSTC
ncbi:MAG TPA: hypothetical protein VFN65_00850 [Solirubrobacteraceae bacterium]|nr:hypothetical protein [Solirubrobacteraceae bacterium]